MIVRSIDSSGDWHFGNGKADYFTGNSAIGALLKMRLLQFLGDCFFDLEAGIDWFHLLGEKNQGAIDFGIKTTILNTDQVIGIEELSQNLDRRTRLYTPSYKVTTVLTGTINTRTLFSGDLLTELGEIITTESGDPISI